MSNKAVRTIDAAPEKGLERHITAGPRSLAAMSRLLGLGKGSSGWSLEGLCGVSGESVRLSLKSGKHRLVFGLRAKAAPGARGLSVAADGEAGTAVRKFLKLAAARLGGRSLEDVLRLIEEDPDSYVETKPRGQRGDHLRVPYVGAPFGLGEAGWRNFFGDQDFDVILGVPECTDNKTVILELADLECFYARPGTSFRRWSFLDYPPEFAEDEVGNKKSDEGGDDGESGEGEESENHIAVELEEREMILGTGEKADAVVAKAKEVTQAGAFLVVSHLCTPIVMGEDLHGLARRCEKISGCTAVGWSQKDRDNQDNFGDYFRALLGRPGFFAAPGDPAAVNLFHFPPYLRQKELIPFLAEIGLKTNICVFPKVDLPSIESLPKARWQVFCERTSYPLKLRELLAKHPRPVVNARAPYGVAGTRECLAAIAKAAGKTAAFDKAWKKRMDSLMPAFAEMKKEAAGYRLAFVVSESTLPKLWELRFGHGAPLVPMIEEMGFGVDLLYYEPHGEAPKLGPEKSSARVTVFRSPWELEKALGEGEFRAVYSDVFFDWRISKAGKARFSARHFEMGLQGAVRTFERLLAACRLPFFHRYARHLARVPRRVHA